MGDSDSFRYKPDEKTKEALKGLEELSQNSSSYGPDSGKIKNYRVIASSGQSRAVPLNKILFIVAFLGALFYAGTRFPEKVMNLLPQALRPWFKKSVGLLPGSIQMKPDQVSGTGESDVSSTENPNLGSSDSSSTAIPPAKRLVQIQGRYYEWNPEGIYNINGQKVFYKDERDRKPETPQPQN